MSKYFVPIINGTWNRGSTCTSIQRKQVSRTMLSLLRLSRQVPLTHSNRAVNSKTMRSNEVIQFYLQILMNVASEMDCVVEFV